MPNTASATTDGRLIAWRVPLASASCGGYGLMVICSGADSVLLLSVCRAMTSRHCPGGTPLMSGRRWEEQLLVRGSIRYQHVPAREPTGSDRQRRQGLHVQPGGFSGFPA